jgi:hypothetical protein
LAGDDDHKIVIYDTQSWTVIASGKTHRSNIIDMAFENDTHFVTTGTKHYRYYTIENKKIRGANGAFGKLDQRISGCTTMTASQAISTVTSMLGKVSHLQWLLPSFTNAELTASRSQIT